MCATKRTASQCYVGGNFQGPHCVVQAGYKLLILLPQSPTCWEVFVAHTQLLGNLSALLVRAFKNWTTGPGDVAELVEASLAHKPLGWVPSTV